MPADEPEAPEQDQIAYLFAVVRNGLALEGRLPSSIISS